MQNAEELMKSFQFSLITTLSRFQMSLHSVFIFPSSGHLEFIYHTYDHDELFLLFRCPKDDTFRFHTGENHHKKFSFLAFNFRNNVPVIYLHCEVFLCRENSQDQRCHTGCSVNRITKRKKRGIEKREVTDGISANYILDNGPIQKPINVDGNGKGILCYFCLSIVPLPVNLTMFNKS